MFFGSCRRLPVSSLFDRWLLLLTLSFTSTWDVRAQGFDIYVEFV
ncbi:hypothetical protein RSAG8_06954, partial [Rhizoctonia solani AG-8 WAC10335]